MISASLLNDTGDVSLINNNVSEFLGYHSEQSFKNIDFFLTNDIAKYHKSYIQNYIHKGSSDKIRSTRTKFILGENNCIFPVMLYYQP